MPFLRPVDPQSTQINGYNAHIILLPRPLKYFLYAVWLLSIAVLSLAAHCLTYNDGDHGNIQALVIACCTQIGVPYILITSAIEAAAPFYNGSAVFGLLISGNVTWAIVVVYLAANLAGGCVHHRGGGTCHRLPNIKGQPYYKAMVGETALSGVIFVLVMVTLVSFSLLYRRARREGQPMMCSSARARQHYQAGQHKDNLAEQSERSWRVTDAEPEGQLAQQSDTSWRVRDIERNGNLAEQGQTSRTLNDVEQGGPLAQQMERRWGVIGVGQDNDLADQSERNWGVSRAERDGELQLEARTKGMSQ